MRETGLPLTTQFDDVMTIPHTIAAFIRKLSQILSYNELQKDKRPPEYIWDNPEELDDWFDKVFELNKGQKQADKVTVIINDDDYEG